MKKWIALISLACLSFYSYAQQHAWKEMEAFDEQVDNVLHPAEAGDLRPVKANSGSLLTRAGQWQASAIPADCNYPALKTDLADLVALCGQLDQAVRLKKGNPEIKRLAMQVHNKFHRVLASVKKA
jgi:hypothetical protein